MNIPQQLTREFNLKPEQVHNIIALIDEGNTIPFIARYRKEMTGSCDDQVLRALSDRLVYLRNLDKRGAEIRSTIADQGKLTPALEEALDQATTLTELEDLYLPYRPKRRTRATMAREKGLEPLADALLRQDPKAQPEELAAAFVRPEAGVHTRQEALGGAQDILAERVSEDAPLRKTLRQMVLRSARIQTRTVEQDDPVYGQYADHAEALDKLPGYRLLAINRGEREGKIKVTLDVPEAPAVDCIRRRYVKPHTPAASRMEAVCADAWNRLLQPSLEREVRAERTAQAVEQAIGLFGANLKPLLLQPPVKGHVVLGLDPAYRTGCKLAVVDETGRMVDSAVIYPTPPQNKVAEAKAVIKRLIRKHGISLISIGNGTASKEAEVFVAELIGEVDESLAYMVVNEAGASVYSASRLAAEEFPGVDVAIRSAASIARRLQDPLAELVKIEPKSIGVGQYQHDMPPARLDEALGAVVEDCVNSVGVDVNTASPSLLRYVAGLSGAVAKNVVAYRDENGRFTSRSQLKKVPRLGPKAYEQCAGFLRIPDSRQVLDRTAVHPETYEAAKALLALFGYTLEDVAMRRLSALPEQVRQRGEGQVAQGLGVGVPTLRDMVQELLKPGRDPRDELPPPLLRRDVMGMEDLRPGMELQGTVRNVIDFGAFVDIGVHQDGLVHISRLSDRYVRHPSDVVRVGDVVTVWVLEVDSTKKRISLSMVPPQ